MMLNCSSCYFWSLGGNCSPTVLFFVFGKCDLCLALPFSNLKQYVVKFAIKVWLWFIWRIFWLKFVFVVFCWPYKFDGFFPCQFSSFIVQVWLWFIWQIFWVEKFIFVYPTLLTGFSNSKTIVKFAKNFRLVPSSSANLSRLILLPLVFSH